MQPSLRRSTSLPGNVPLGRWYQLHIHSLLAYVRQHVPSREDAEDIVTETFIAALEQKEPAFFALNEQEQLAWLRRVAYHKCIDQYRRSVRRPLVPLEEHTEALYEDERLNPDQVALRHEENELLYQRLNQLPDHYRTILQLRFANGLRCTEISQRLDKSEGAIRVLLSRALNMLRGIYLSPLEEDHDEIR